MIIENESIQEQDLQDSEEIKKNPSIGVKQSDNKQSATYTFYDEDHTMGNLFRYCFIKNPKVSFSGYTIVHPSESVMKLRIQTN